MMKALASIVIVGCLAAQTYVIVRPSRARFYPFLDYPMYGHAYQPGALLRWRELRARPCDPGAATRPILFTALGYPDNHDAGELRAIALGYRSAPRHRARYSQLARERLTPTPCALAIWEREITLSRAGVDPREIATPRWTPRVEWAVDDPAHVRVLTPRPPLRATTRPGG